VPEIEVPTEHLHEAIHEEVHQHAHGSAGHPGRDLWFLQIALSSALLAVLAALAALLAGHHANEAMIEQMQASDQWSYYQAKGIKANLLQTKVELLGALGKEATKQDEEKVGDYRREQKEIEEKAHEKEQSSADHLRRHNVLARTVTLLQVAIALSAIAALTRRRVLWFASLALGAAGALFFVQGLR
jgi:hypothetical protein